MAPVMNLLRYVGICDPWDVNPFCLRSAAREKETESYLSTTVLALGLLETFLYSRTFSNIKRSAYHM